MMITVKKSLIFERFVFPKTVVSCLICLPIPTKAGNSFEAAIDFVCAVSFPEVNQGV